MRVLLTDGSGLTGRQAALLLAAAGHEVGVLATSNLGLTRFTRAVRHWHRVPWLSVDPQRWLAAALSGYHRGRYDVLLPTQEQVAVLSWAAAQGRLTGVRTVVPPFESLVRIQDKISAQATLEQLDLPRPQGRVVAGAAELAAWKRFPVYVKLPIGTASTAVLRVDGLGGLQSAVARVTAWGAFEQTATGVLVQDAVEGPLLMIQALFDQGRLVALHACRRVQEGVGGGASHKVGVGAGELRPILTRLGTGLGWHGPLSADAVQTPAGPVLIDLNPRLVEPMNAALSGVDLVEPTLRLAWGEHPEPTRPGRSGVRTHQGMLAILAAARAGRRAVVGELAILATKRGDYAASREELTPTAGDWRAAIPLIAVAATALAGPRAAQNLAANAVQGYALSAEGWRELLAQRPGETQSPPG